MRKDGAPAQRQRTPEDKKKGTEIRVKENKRKIQKHKILEEEKNRALMKTPIFAFHTPQ